ncbi:uncharacterized protein LOC135153622 [Lytechinus pictus]|uniref:uncharacterized protein LOC135153622 n=1 Tax=Lytechinus pictus TaxID=7653 RepID=UPI0030B9BFD2
MVDRLKIKIKKSQKKNIGNRNAEKEERRVEIGWKDFDVASMEYKQIRTSKGGGTRHLKLGKNATAGDVIKEGRRLFFPDNMSFRGHVDDFYFHVEDFRGKLFSEGNVEDLYLETEVKMLRIYICSKKKGKSQKTSNDTDEDISFYPDEADEDLDETLPMIPLTPETGISHTAIESVIDLTLFELVPQLEQEQEMESDHEQPSTSNAPPSRTEGLAIEEPLLTQGLQILGEELEKRSLVKLHRCIVITELLCNFKAPDMMTSPLKFEFVDELGIDAEGVSRDVYTIFWKQFFEMYADGEDFRVPGLCPELGPEEWKAVGRILVKGFIDHKIFPLRMAPAFVIGMLFGEDAVLPDTLMESFKLYLNDGDRACVQSALSGNTTEEEHEALVDLLDREGGHTIPKEGESLALMFQLAHKVIIQNGSYAMQCMREVVTPQLLSKLPTPSVVLSIYQELQPTTKKVCEIFSAIPSNQEESNSVRFLMQYIKGQDKKGLKKLMHFLTGSEVMSVSKIMVQFTSLEGAGRRPVAHTCGPTLELPSTYGSYREFRQEWDCVLASGYMNFDFG